MKHISIRTLLAITSLFIMGYSNAITPTPDQQDGEIKDVYDHVLSDNGPDASLGELELAKQIKNQNRALRAGSPTYTYIRCYYVENASLYSSLGIKNLTYGYVWAENPNGSYYKLNGNWHDSSIVAFKNMFFTDVRLKDIKQLCTNTINREKNISSYRYVPLEEVAADNRISYDHTIWQNDTQSDNAKTINKIISFGDSLTDTNNMYNASQWYMPTYSWMDGRFSNGYVWTEYLAQDFGLPLYNWAIGGSAGDKQYGVLPGLIQQVDSWKKYATSALNYQPGRSLATLLIGGNDFITYGDVTVEKVLDDVENSIRELYKNGIRHVLVLNLPDLTIAPVFKYKDAQYRNEVFQKAESYNKRLPILIARLNQTLPNADIHMFNAEVALDKILSHPHNYGFDDIRDSCLDINGDVSASVYIWKPFPFSYTGPSRRDGCRNPRGYLFWDNMHITTRGHQVLEEELKQDPWIKNLFGI